ncbi:MAG: hypothetical protein ABW034_08715 [Steroidobacteraceae bacterium]
MIVKSCRGRWYLAALLLFALLMGVAPRTHAEDCVADFGGVLDGNVIPTPPSQIQVDGNCTVRNYPLSNPLTTNFSFLTQPGQSDERWLVIFDNVVHTGNMSCDAVHEHKLWFTNTSFSTISPNCQNLLIPVEKIDKQSPGSSAAIGVPFTYRMTVPVLFDPATGTVINFQGSVNDLHSIVITDDLNATGAVLSYVSHSVYWEDTGAPLTHTFANAGGVLSFSNFGVVQANRQFVIEVTVVLEDVPANAIGTQFINTAKWQFGRLIDGTFYQPLPGEWGVSSPMTIVAPNLTLTKSGPATMNLGTAGQFVLDVHNTGSGDAWNVNIRDRLPNGPTGGMCDLAPQIASVTLGGNTIAQGTGYVTTFTGAPACELTLTLLDGAGPIEAGEHLLVTYQSRLDSGTDNGVTLTNVAGAVQWFNGDSTAAERIAFNRPLTNGTVGTLDHQDAHTVTVALVGTFFEKTAANLRSGDDPASIAAPGDTLRYTLRVRTTNAALSNFSIIDELDASNTPAAFVPGSLTLVGALPAGAVNNTNPNGGAKGTGLINIGNLNLPADSELIIRFDITVAATAAAGTIVSNQGQLLTNGSPFMVSDDPNVNGQADPFVNGDEDPTRVTVVVPTLQLTKTVLTGGTANPGDVVRYRLQLTNVSNIPFSGFSLLDELDQLNDPAMFVPGTLTLVTAVPAGATNNSNATGGARSTGVLDIRNLRIGAQGAPNETVTLEFTAQLVPVIANATVLLNQARLTVAGTTLLLSDDPALSGPQDPTPIVIQSAPVFRVQKISQDMSGDPNVLLPGETLRYTLTVKNIGNANATDAVLRDQIPSNTTYVAGSTRLNGTSVPDAGGVAPLVAGISIYAPENPTSGALRADASATTSNVATITFDVVIDADTAQGTVISNQGFVSAAVNGILDYPSDDPTTPLINDPTRDIVGYLPLIYADKRAVLQVDGGTPGVIDPNDVLRYTITVYNFGNVDATNVVLRDQVPANTTYVADSTTLNTLAVARPDGGTSPLIAGVDISSSDLTPPAPAPAQGTLTAGQSAVIQFDLRVNAGVPAGTLITNQARVYSEQLPQVLTDGDGNPATGPEPTVIVVGSGQQLSITKQVSVVGGGAALAGSTLDYIVRVTNIGTVPAYYVSITDDLNAATPGYLTYVDQSATLNGAANGISIAGPVISADYFATYGPLQPGASAVLRFRATIVRTAAIGSRVTNTAEATWNNPPQTVRASVSIDVGGMVGVGILAGHIWHDANFNTTLDSTERMFADWRVELYRNERLIHSALTDANGAYRISGVAPNYQTADRYELRFSAPNSGASTAKLGRAHSSFTNDLQRIADIVVQAGSNLPNLNLPLAPNGVVYNTIARTPIAGATVTMRSASGAVLPSSCFYDPAQQNQITLDYGYYRFDLSFADPACPSGAGYVIDVSAPAPGYIAGPSQIIPPTSAAATTAFSVPTCPAGADDAIPATAQHCEVQPSELAPQPAVRARTLGTRYHLHVLLDDSQVPGSSQIFNNHIPVDPDLQGVLAMTKTTPMLNVTRGQLVPYVITYRNVTPVPLFDVRVVDRLPPGFSYVKDSARLDDVPVEPTLVGRELMWSDLSVEGSARHTLVMLLTVGAGVGEGEFVNRVQSVHQLTGQALSNEATATVRVIPDATFDCTDVTGKVYDDANRNGYQDSGERGLSGVRVVSARGLTAITDGYGRFHITCAITPREDRGSNFVLKLDDRTLPSGYRASTQPLRIERATRGKALRFNFGASIHRVIGLDLTDAVFEPGTTEMRKHWQPRLDLLLEQLQKGPAVLRLSYLADIENEALVQRRLAVIKQEVMRRWQGLNCCYALIVEPEVFWRLGAPPERTSMREPQTKQSR